MAMQSGLVYGRLIVGQAKQIVRNLVVKGLSPSQSYRLVTAYCGFAKLSNNQPKRKFLYGEDSFLITENKFANVLGRFRRLRAILYPQLRASVMNRLIPKRRMTRGRLEHLRKNYNRVLLCPFVRR